MKRQILEMIFDCFDEWSNQFELACRKGCAVCCTTDVSMTALEGEVLLDYIISQKGPEWLSQKLDSPLVRQAPLQTTNEYAKACLEGREAEIGELRRGGQCPFLEDEICAVYPVRPFACRCFGSTTSCSRGGNAVLPPEYLSGATAVSQIIEHLGQFSLWGTMVDILYLQASAAGHLSRSEHHRENLAAARGNCLTARPLPGFLIEESVADRVTPLLESIFASRIRGRRIEDILNNR